jgi:hypothetical protein
MSEENNKPSDDEQKPQLVDVLIKVAMDYTSTHPMNLGEVYGSFGIAQRVLFDRVVASSQAQSQNEGPAGDVDTEGQKDASQDEA